MAHVKLLGLSGALRKGSTNTLLLQEAARLMGDAELTSLTSICHFMTAIWKRLKACLLLCKSLRHRFLRRMLS